MFSPPVILFEFFLYQCARHFFVEQYLCAPGTEPNVFAELDKLLENAPSLVIMQHSARISIIRKRISALNMLLKSIQRRIDNIDRIISTGLTSGTAHGNNVIF